MHQENVLTTQQQSASKTCGNVRGCMQQSDREGLRKGGGVGGKKFDTEVYSITQVTYSMWQLVRV